MAARFNALIASGLALLAFPAALTSVRLDPVGKSNVKGNATVEPAGTDSVRTTVEITGAEPGSILPWHIHDGACGSNGKVLGTPMAYPPLKVGQDGVASVSATLALSLPGASQHSINIHKSSSDMTLVACGTFSSGDQPQPRSAQPEAPKPEAPKPEGP